MNIEDLLLDFMANVNDSLKSEGTEAEKLKRIWQAKHQAEMQYAKLATMPAIDVEQLPC